MAKEQPWKPADATLEIRARANGGFDVLSWTAHAEDRMEERDLIMRDILYALKNGFVYDEAKPSTRGRFFKYRVHSQTPNSGNREIGVVVIPDPKSAQLKIVTVMWADEPWQ